MRDHHTPAASGHHTATNHYDQGQGSVASNNNAHALDRSDSYVLARGGPKLVSSRSWEAEEVPLTADNVFTNMHALDGRSREGQVAGIHRQASSGTSSDTGASNTSTSSSSSDESSEEEYDVTTLSRAPRPTGYANPKAREDPGYKSFTSKTYEDSDAAIPAVFELRCHGEAEGAGVKVGRQPGDGHPGHPSAHLDTTYYLEDHIQDPHSDLTTTNTHHNNMTQGVGSDSDCDTDETETESTVRARLPAGLVGVEDPGGGQDQEGDHNDTLSTLSGGDLSFDDRDVSSPTREQVSSAPRQPEDGVLRAPPEGGHVSASESGYSPGVFCITGYAKGVPTSLATTAPGTVEVSQSERATELYRSSVERAEKLRQETEDNRRFEEAQEMQREISHLEIIQRMEREAREIREEEEQVRRDEIEAEQREALLKSSLRGPAEGGKRGGGNVSGMPQQQGTNAQHFPPNYLSGHSRVAHLRGTWDLTQTGPTDAAVPPTSVTALAQAPGARSRSSSSRTMMYTPPSHPQADALNHQLQVYIQNGHHPSINDILQHQTSPTYQTNPNILEVLSKDTQAAGRRSPRRDIIWQPDNNTSSMPYMRGREDVSSGRRSVDSLVPIRDAPHGDYGMRSMDRRDPKHRSGRSSVDTLWSQQRPGLSPLDNAAPRPSPRGHPSHPSPQSPVRTPHSNGSGSVSGSEDFEWVRQSPMLTGLLEGHVTRLATPPDLRHHHHHRTSSSSLATPPESGEEVTSTGPTNNHRQPRHHPRPPPAPRPRTLDPGDLLSHRTPVRDSRDRVYTPSRDHHGHRRSRDASSERLREPSCDRVSNSVVLHQSPHLQSPHHQSPHHQSPHHPHQHGYQGHQYPARSHCDCAACLADEEEGGYDSCSDERHHRHSYHEGQHHQPGHHQPGHHQPGHQHHNLRSRDSSRDRRAPSRQGSGCPSDSGRSSPCCCRSHLGSCNSLSSPQQEYYSGSGSSKGITLEERVQRLEGDKDSLQLQVTVLTEQVEAQTEKIHDLENLLDQKKALLLKTEDQLQKEVMTRSSLETQRLQLFSEISNLKLRQAACESENVELRDKLRRSDPSEHNKGQLLTQAQVGNSPSPSTISTLSTIPASSPNKASPGGGSGSPSASPFSNHDVRDFSQPRLSKTPPPNARRKIDQFGTLPRNQRDLINHDGDINQGSATTGRTQKGVMFGRSFHFLPFRVAGKRSTSAPNLAETERQMLDDLHDGGYLGDGALESQRQVSSSHVALTGPRSPPTSHKTTGIKKIFTRLRRSSSGQIEAGSDLGDGDFKRGGIRSTASARLGWSTPISTFKEPSNPFTSWNLDTMDSWLSSLGLNQYIAAVRSWTEAGHHLSKVTSHQLERDLGFRHPLHKKKIQLALSARLSGEDLNTPLQRLDHTWVLRWLDDIGLPQYKDAFSDGRIDGRVLNCLTFDDLAFLRFSNLLHVTSLKRGIQVLRLHNFDCTVLKRRSVPEEGQRHRTPTEVALWTNHRVMEWLRTVDLSEYAPNLRGSGVHGAFMVYEVKFTAELLAAVLSIPSSKTLLRRHLNTHFKELVGQTTVQEKRELQAAPGYQPLTTSLKVKMPKKSQFSLKRKKSKSDLEFDDLLCPLDEKTPLGVQQDKEKETNGDGRLC